MIEIKIEKEEIDLNKFWEMFGGMEKLKEKTDIISSKKLMEGKEEITISIPQLYFRGLPFKFRKNDKCG